MGLTSPSIATSLFFSPLHTKGKEKEKEKGKEKENEEEQKHDQVAWILQNVQTDEGAW